MIIFDVARWSIGDIEMKCQELGLDINTDNTDEIIDYLDNTFDASIGINWDVIEDAILAVKELNQGE